MGEKQVLRLTDSIRSRRTGIRPRHLMGEGCKRGGARCGISLDLPGWYDQAVDLTILSTPPHSCLPPFLHSQATDTIDPLRYNGYNPFPYFVVIDLLRTKVHAI